MPLYKNFNLNDSTTPKPWAPREFQAWKDLIDTVVGDAITASKTTSGHLHGRVYNGYGDPILDADNLSHDITFGDNTVGSTLTIDLGAASMDAFKILEGANVLFHVDTDNEKNLLKYNTEIEGDVYVDGYLGVGTLTPSSPIEYNNYPELGTAWYDAERLALISTNTIASLISADSGTWGSQIGLKQSRASDGTFENAWGIARQTNSGGSGDGSLRFTYGTNKAVSLNTTYLKISPTGSELNSALKVTNGNFDLWRGGLGVVSILAGADESSPSARTNNIDKYMTLAVPHKTNAEEPFGILFATSETDNYLRVGGGYTHMNAMTKFALFFATNNNTPIGTQRVLVDYNTFTLSNALAVNSTANVTGKVTIGGDVEVANDKYIGCTSDTDLLKIGNGLLTISGNTAIGANYIGYNGTITKGLTFASDSRAIFYAPAAILGDARYVLQVRDDSYYGALVGGGIVFAGKYDSSGEYGNFAGIKGVKANAIDGNNAGQLHFQTRPNGANPITHVMMNESGYVYLYSIRSGATQAAAGALANELWKTLGHATLPDNVVMIGV